MKRILSFAVAIIFAFGASAQKTVSLEGADETVRLWDNTTAKFSNHQTKDEQFQEGKKRTILYTSSCELYIYKAVIDKNQGAAIVLFPGGGYGKLSMQISLAKWYASQGITAVLVKYRLPNGYKEATLEDAMGAIRYTCTRVDLGIDPTKVGVTGSSAGGHLAAWVSNALPDEEKPAFAVLHYPAIDRTSPYYINTKTYTGNLLGENFTLQEAKEISAHNMVSATTPATMLLLCDDDTAVPPTSPVSYYKALINYGVKASLHIYPKGGHSLKNHISEYQPAILDWLDFLGIHTKEIVTNP